MRNLTLIVACVLLAAGTAIFVRAVKNYRTSDIKKYGAIVRLHYAQTGSFFCSGTVISDNQIVTAAHCVEDVPRGEAVIEVRTQDNVRIGVLATVLSFEVRMDQALLGGDFSAFDHMKVETDPAVIDAIFRDAKSNIKFCGFALAGPLSCSTFKTNPTAHFGFKYASDVGFLYPGMSGGPVIDLKTGKLIAVNWGVNDHSVLVSPLASIFDNLSN